VEAKLKAAIESSDNPKAAADIINWALAHKAQIGELIAAINAITTGENMKAKAVGICAIITLVAADIDELGPIVTPPVVDPPSGGDDVFGAKADHSINNPGGVFGDMTLEEVEAWYEQMMPGWREKMGAHDPVALGGLITILPLLIKLWPLIQQIIALIQSAKG
jgi:hypothetical protein